MLRCCKIATAKLAFFSSVGLAPLFLSACSQTADQAIFAEKCANEDPNCQNSQLMLATSGARTDLAAQAVRSGDDVGAVPIKPVRLNDKTSFSFIVQNSRLVPLRSFSLDRSIATGYTVESAGSEDCAAISVLLYNQTCRVKISFAPGSLAPDLSLNFNFKTLLGDTVTFTAAVTGAVIKADFNLSGTVSFPDELVHDPTDTANAVTSDLTISNPGTSDTLKSISFTITGPAAADFTLAAPSGGTDCTAGQDLAPNGASCVLHLRYLPLKPGFRFATLNLFSTSGQIRSFALSGRALAISATPAIGAFGSHVTSGATHDVSFSVANAHTSLSATSCSYSLTGSAQFAIASNTCSNPGPLAASANCTVTVRYTPTAAVAWHGGTLSASCDTRGGSFSVALSAESVTSTLRADVSAVEFGEVLIGDSLSSAITLTNTGASSLTNLLASVSAFSGSGISISSTTCTTTLAASASCAVTVGFSPTAAGTSLSTLAATSDSDSLTNAISLHGQALGLQSSTSSVDFGSITTTEDRFASPITIVNPSASATMSDCSFDASTLEAQGFSFDSTSTCPTTTQLAPGATCTLIPRFTATDTLGPRSASTAMTCTKGGTTSIAFKGQVVSDLTLVVLPPSTVNFATRLVGITATQDFTFADQSSSTAVSALSVTAPGITSPWSVLNAGASDCSAFASLLAGQSCVFRLQYQPGAPFGSEQTGTSGSSLSVTASGLSPSAPTYSATAVKITPSNTSLNFGIIGTGVNSSILYTSVRNPSDVDDASSCSLSAGAPFTIASTTCGATLLRQDSCLIGVQVPSQAVAASLSGSLTMDCSIGGRASVSLAASVHVFPTLAWSGSGAFGNVDIGSTASATLTLTHTGAVLDDATTALAISLLATSSTAFTLTGTNCPAVLSPGNSCTASVSFAPLTAGALTGTLRAFDPVVTADLSLSGTGVDTSTRLVPSPTSVNLTGRLVGITVDTDITVTNNAASGSATGVAVGTPTSGAPWNLGASPSPCGATLATAASCTVRLTYNPTSTGTTSGTVGLTASNMSPARSIAYSGSAIKITSDTTSLDFGTIETGVAYTKNTTITLSNPSSVDDATGCSLSGDSNFSIVNSTCGATLAKGSTCTFKVQLTSQASSGTVSGSAGMSCTVGGGVTLSLSAQIIPAPILKIKDNRANNTYVTAITTTDITGSIGDSNNVVGSGSRSVTYTLTNAAASGSSPLTIGTIPSPTHSAGTNGTMAISSDLCSGATLASGATCTFDVTFTAASAPLTSTFTLTVGGTSGASGTSYTAAITNILGTCITPASLAVSSSQVTIGPFTIVDSTTTASSATYTLTNSGQQSATNTVLSIVAPSSGSDDHALYTRLYDVATDCGFGNANDYTSFTLAGGASCNLRFRLSPVGAVGSYKAALSVASTQTGTLSEVPIKGSSQINQLATSADGYGYEADLTADADRFYQISRFDPGSGQTNPVLTICSRESKGTPKISDCVLNDLVSILGLTGSVNLSGSVVGSGPRITQMNKKILIAVTNSEVGVGAAGGTTNGSKTLIICQKPTSGNTLNNGDCTLFLVDATDASGPFPAIAATSTTVILGNASGPPGNANKLAVTVCSYSSSTSTTDSSTLNLAGCKSATSGVGDADQGLYPAVSWDGSRAVFATYDSTGSKGLRLASCSIAGDNTPTCASSLVESTLYSGLNPGYYPSLVLDTSNVYVVHQVGPLSNVRMQLTSCAISGSTLGACSTQTVASDAGSGGTPRIAMSGNSTSGRLWMTAMTYTTAASSSSTARILTYQCSLPLGSCASVASHAGQPSAAGYGPMYSRSIYFDSTYKILVAPYQAYVAAPFAYSKMGFFSLGLLPEL